MEPFWNQCILQDNIDPLVTSVSAIVIAVTVVFMIAMDRLYGLDKLLSGRGQE